MSWEKKAPALHIVAEQAMKIGEAL